MVSLVSQMFRLFQDGISTFPCMQLQIWPQQALNEAKQNAAIESQSLRQEVEDAKQTNAKAKSDLESLQLELQGARASGAESATLAQELSEAKQAAAQAKSQLETLQLRSQSMESSFTSLKEQLEAAVQSEAETKAKLAQTLHGLPDPNQADVAIEQGGLQKGVLNASHTATEYHRILFHR